MAAKVDIKCILLGSSNVGKTSLVSMYCFDSFDTATVSTIGAAFALKQYKNFNIGIWDTAGQEKFDSISTFYCRGATTAFLVPIDSVPLLPSLSFLPYLNEEVF